MEDIDSSQDANQPLKTFEGPYALETETRHEAHGDLVNQPGGPYDIESCVLIIEANNYRTKKVNGLSMSLSDGGSLKLFQGDSELYTANLNVKLGACEILLQQNNVAVAEPVFELRFELESGDMLSLKLSLFDGMHALEALYPFFPRREEDGNVVTCPRNGGIEYWNIITLGCIVNGAPTMLTLLGPKFCTKFRRLWTRNFAVVTVIIALISLYSFLALLDRTYSGWRASFLARVTAVMNPFFRRAFNWLMNSLRLWIPLAMFEPVLRGLSSAIILFTPIFNAILWLRKQVFGGGSVVLEVGREIGWRTAALREAGKVKGAGKVLIGGVKAVKGGLQAVNGGFIAARSLNQDNRHTTVAGANGMTQRPKGKGKSSK